MPRPQGRRIRSNCWHFYTKTDDGGLCNMCKKEVRSTGNTTNLLNHLKRRHTVQYSEYLRDPEKFQNGEEDSHLGHDDDDMGDEIEQDEAAEASQAIEESNQSHNMEAFHADQGGTVIWLQPTQEGQSNGFQPQITIVQHSVPENSEGGEQGGGETILGSGEIVTNDASRSDNGLPTPEVTKALPDTQSHRKVTVQNSSVKMPTKFNRPQVARPQSFSNLCNTPVKMVRPVTDTTNHVNRDDTYDSFGKYVASLLRNLPSKKAACRLQKDIIWLVLQEQIRNEDS